MGIPFDLTGQKFGRLTVVESNGRGKGNCVLWKCLCDCGNTIVVKTSSLNSGHTRSCGCLHQETVRTAALKHGGGGTRLYYCWHGMIDRCENPSNSRYARYGGRGIKVCKEWHDFSAFRDWAMSKGYSDTLTIDRIDNNGNYEPSNCRWATAKEQANNRGNKSNARSDI